MPKLTERACPCCGGRRAEVLHSMGFTLPAGSPLPERYDLVACDACGSCHADTPKTQADYDFYYAEFSKYESETLASGSGADADDAARLRETAAALAGHVTATARVLDIGAATGGLLAALRERGFQQLAGLDPSPRCVEVMQRAGFAAARGALTDPFETPKKYDLVVLSHVLEHVLEVRGALRNVGAALADDGLVYVEVPDAGAYAEYLRTPFYYFDSEHINHFDTAKLTELLRRCGYGAVASGRKALKLPDGPPYPALWVLARHQPSVAAIPAPAPDFSLRDTLKAYIAQSEAGSANVAIDELAASRQPVLIWGAGQNTMRLLHSSRLAECNIVGIVDGDARKQGQLFAGHTVGAPQSLADRQDRPVVLISAAIHGRRIAEELQKLRPEQPFTLV